VNGFGRKRNTPLATKSSDQFGLKMEAVSAFIDETNLPKK